MSASSDIPTPPFVDPGLYHVILEGKKDIKKSHAFERSHDLGYISLLESDCQNRSISAQGVDFFISSFP